MSQDASQSEKKIIVDEDWKTRVEAERQAAEKPEAPAKPTRAEEDVPLPPPNLSYLVSTLYLQGAIAMGLLPNPINQKAEFHPNRARHAIDILAMLQEKTAGNRTPEESEELEAVLYRLRMAFVEIQARGRA